jgi:hypothetical protein
LNFIEGEGLRKTPIIPATVIPDNYTHRKVLAGKAKRSAIPSLNDRLQLAAFNPGVSG